MRKRVAAAGLPRYLSTPFSFFGCYSSLHVTFFFASSLFLLFDFFIGLLRLGYLSFVFAVRIEALRNQTSSSSCGKLSESEKLHLRSST